MSIFSLINPLMAQSSDTIPDIRKICFDFMLSKGEVSKDSERYLYLTEDKKEQDAIIPLPFVYDMTNKKDIMGHDLVPVQESLIKYIIQTLNPHGLSYLMIVKNGIYEIIDTGESLNNILDQIIRYSRNNAMTSDELLDVLDSACDCINLTVLCTGVSPLC